ncbi:hypothetical protein ACGRHY_19785 [Streptomyces sp. HK10]|uniref:hypothetical protein n=1 Tax=Streptomyces sp. HK10 TaxID=3373255 RepID=UPI0037485195
MMRLSRSGAGLLATALLLTSVVGCVGSSSRAGPETGDSASPQPTAATAGGTRDGGNRPRGWERVVTAECGMGARLGSVTVRGWNPHTWKRLWERSFAVTGKIAFGSGPDAFLTPLFDLCRTDPLKAAYQSDALERVVPRARAVFDRNFTRMAVVLYGPDGGREESHVGFVDVQEDGAGDLITDLTERGGDGGQAPREENAVFSPDGARIWFTYRASDGRRRIGSRSVTGDSSLKDEGPATDRNLPLFVVGEPQRGIQAEMVRLSPDGRLMTARTDELNGKVLFEVPAASTALTPGTAKGARELEGCYHAVGWTGSDTVLCRTAEGDIRTFGTSASAAPGPVLVPANGTVNEGMVVSPDGRRFVFVKHPPGDPYEGFQGFYASGTAPGEQPEKLPVDSLEGRTLFLEWR